MATMLRRREEIPAEYTWALDSVFATPEDWERTFQEVERAIPDLERFRGHLGDGARTLLDWFAVSEKVLIDLGKLRIYATNGHNVETADPEAKARNDRILGLIARIAAATSFDEPEILAIGLKTLRRWEQEVPELAVYDHAFEALERRRAHVRSSEVEELLGLIQEPFLNSSSIHRTLTDTDLTFHPAQGESGDEHPIAQGVYGALLSSPDRAVRRTAWENYADAHLAMKNTLAACLSSGVKQDVFEARARRYSSSLEAALQPNHIPLEVFHNLIATFRRNLPTWHRYWRIRRQALGYGELHEYDIKAPLTDRAIEVPYDQSVEWIVEGMRPLGTEYVEMMRRGLGEERWVDVYPNEGKRSGAYSSGAVGTRPFILMSYNDDLFSMSTLAHELGHSMHSHLTRRTQPFVYARYGMFVAEVVSNFNQALVRAHLLDTNPDPDFQIGLIEEAMSNFHRYFFIMPTLARFELEIHERVERGEALSPDSLIALTAGLFREVYGEEVVMDTERTGITWGEFPIHLYLNFYVFQYATGIAAAQALSQQVLDEGPEAAQRYLEFLKSGSSLYPLDALKLAGVDMASPEPVQRAFDVMAGMVDRLATLVGAS